MEILKRIVYNVNMVFGFDFILNFCPPGCSGFIFTGVPVVCFSSNVLFMRVLSVSPCGSTAYSVLRRWLTEDVVREIMSYVCSEHLILNSFFCISFSWLIENMDESFGRGVMFISCWKGKVRIYMYVDYYVVELDYESGDLNLWRVPLRHEEYNSDKAIEAYDFYFDPEATVSASVEFEYFGQLSGANGEWTGTDDFDNDESKRRHKESVTHTVHSSTTQHKKKDGELPKINKPCNDFLQGKCDRENCRFNHPDRENVGSEATVVVVPHVSTTRSFKGYGYVLGDKKITKSKDTPFEYDCECKCVIPTFSAFGRVLEYRQVTISPVLAQLILVNLRVLPDESRNFVAILNFVTDALHSVFPALVIYDHVWFYSFRNVGKCVPNSIEGVARNIFQPLNSGLIGIVERTISPRDTYQYNQGWRILSSNGFSFDAEDGNVIQYPRFETNLDLVVTSSNKRYFCRFSPVKQFQNYGKCGVNVCSALSRYFKCRGTLDDEIRLKTNQFKLMGRVNDHLISALATVCGASYSDGYLRTRKVYCGGPIPNQSQPYKIELITSSFLDMLDNNLFSRLSYRVYFWNKLMEYLSSVFDSVWNNIITHVYSHVFNFCDYLYLLWLFSFLPHPKRVLRQRWVMDDHSIKKIVDNLGDFESKFKDEDGKFNKVGRLYATITENSIMEPQTVEIVKKLTCQRFLLGMLSCGGSVYAEFSDDAAPKDSDKMFKDVSQIQSGDVVFKYYSDDGFVFSRMDGNEEIYETDIKSCDASNGFAVSFVLLYLADKMGLTEGMVRLLALSSKPTIIRNPDCSGEYVRLQPETTFEYSGEPTTTIKNNCASLACAYGAYNRLRLGSTIGDSIRLGADDFGWQLTVQRKFSFNSLTFLKRSYSVRCKRSWLVYGTIFRSLGVVDGELNPIQFGLSKSQFRTKSYSDLFEIALKMRVDGLVNEPTSPVLCALRVRVNGGVFPSSFQITQQDLYERYMCSSSEVSELINFILNLKLGDFIVCSFLEKIFSVDYGCDETRVVHEIDPEFSQVDDLM